MAALERGFDDALADLVELARIPGVSAPGFDPEHVVRSAECVAALLERSGLERVELLRLPGAHPYVVAEKRAARADAPTALVYAHHDVQPPGRPERWQTPAFEPTVRADGRLYGVASSTTRRACCSTLRRCGPGSRRRARPRYT